MTRLIFSALLALNISVLSTGASATGSGEGKGAKIKDDWITINKDYSSQRYVDLDQITPTNVSGLKEVCEIQLNEPIWFSSGILKVGARCTSAPPASPTRSTRRLVTFAGAM